MKLILEFEAEALQGRDLSTPLMDLAREGAVSSLEVKDLDAGSVSGLTPDGRELKISWRVEG